MCEYRIPRQILFRTTAIFIHMKLSCNHNIGMPTQGFKSKSLAHMTWDFNVSWSQKLRGQFYLNTWTCRCDKWTWTCQWDKYTSHSTCIGIPVHILWARGRFWSCFSIFCSSTVKAADIFCMWWSGLCRNSSSDNTS